jgi:DNA (cytosine-5)-methyltransferase 1
VSAILDLQLGAQSLRGQEVEPAGGIRSSGHHSDANLVTIEDVPQLVRESVIDNFVELLRGNDFHVTHEVVECVRFSVPQARRRLVLLASRLGPIRHVKPDERFDASVRNAIGHLPELAAGGRDSNDHLHASLQLSPPQPG